MALMISVIYKQRALPLVWVVVAQAKGHLAEAQHVQLLAQAQALVPAGATVIVVGDGEFDGVTWQATLQDYGWEYVCRTAKNVQLGVVDAETLAPFETVNVQPGECIALFDVTFSQQLYGPVLAIAWWDAAYKQPIYLVSNMALCAEACYWYRRRYRIETFFSDQKSRGFNLQKRDGGAAALHASTKIAAGRSNALSILGRRLVSGRYDAGAASPKRRLPWGS